MRKTSEEERLEKRLAVVERDNARLREGPRPEAGLDGCGSSGCVVRTPTGMAPVGQCRCGEDALRRMVGWQKAEIAKLRAVLDSAKPSAADYTYEVYNELHPGGLFKGAL